MSDAAARPDGGVELARGAAVNTVAMLASNLRGVFTFLVARLLGQAALGAFSVAWTMVDLISKLGIFGLDTSAMTFIARANASGDRAAGRALFRRATAHAVVQASAVAIAANAVLWLAGDALGVPAAVRPALAVVLCALPGVGLYRVSTASSRGMKVMRHDIFSRGLTETTGTTLALLAAIAFGWRRFAPEIAAVAGTGASGVVAFALARSLFRSAPRAGRRAARGLLAHAAPIAGYDLLNTAIVQLDIVMLGWFVGRAPGVTLAAVGIYAAAADVASGLRKVNQAFNPIFTPIISGMVATGSRAGAVQAYARLARWMLAILLPLVVVMALAGTAILAIYGSAFRQGASWLAIVSVACATNAFVGLGETVIMIERPRLNLLNSTITFVVAVGANLWLIPRYGVTGAAVGILVPYLVQGVLRAAELRFVFRWRIPLRQFARPIAATAAAIVPALLCRFALRGAIGDLAGPLASAAVFLGAYFGMWRLIGLDADDRLTLAELTGGRVPARAA